MLLVRAASSRERSDRKRWLRLSRPARRLRTRNPCRGPAGRRAQSPWSVMPAKRERHDVAATVTPLERLLDSSTSDPAAGHQGSVDVKQQDGGHGRGPIPHQKFPDKKSVPGQEKSSARSGSSRPQITMATPPRSAALPPANRPQPRLAVVRLKAQAACLRSSDRARRPTVR